LKVESFKHCVRLIGALGIGPDGALRYGVDVTL
jgi:hypothetical protein